MKKILKLLECVLEEGGRPRVRERRERGRVRRVREISIYRLENKYLDILG